MAEVRYRTVDKRLDLRFIRYVGNVCPQSVGTEIQLLCELLDFFRIAS